MLLVDDEPVALAEGLADLQRDAGNDVPQEILQRESR
jgi:hypothetical protein